MNRLSARVFLSFILTLLILSFPISLASCGKSEAPVPCRSVLLSMTEAETDLPAGRTYCAIGGGERDQLSDALADALLGSSASVRTSWLDYALFLSLGETPCEFAVILCNSRDAAEDTARLFSARLHLIRAANVGASTEGTVTLRGNYVLYILSFDPETALRMAKSQIG